jgi:hemolysin III
MKQPFDHESGTQIMALRQYLGKEPVSFATHFFGLLLTVAGLVTLIVLSAHDSAKMIGMILYGSSLAMVFLASSCFHYFDLGKEGNLLLQKFDHAAIYLLIGGSYIPILLQFLDGSWRIVMLSIVCTLSIAGAIMKFFWMDCPRRLSVAMYLGLGWIIVIPGYKMFPQFSLRLTICLAAAGLIYSVGAVIYALKKPNIWPNYLGFHEIWHLFVLGGAGAHFLFVLDLCSYQRPPF